MLENETKSNILHLLKNAEDIIILAHDIPDGDTIGACLGLWFALKEININSRLVCCDDIPSFFNFLTCVEEFTNLTNVHLSQKSLIISIDIAAKKMSKLLLEEVNIPIINIDHHPSNTNFGTINIIYPTKSSASEIIFDLLKDFSLPVTKNSANSLLAGILYDTLNLSTRNTNSDTLKTAANLIETGADMYFLQKNLFGFLTVEQEIFRANVLSKLKTEKDGQIAWSIITKKQYESIPNPDQEARSIVAEMQNLIGIKISILFVEKEEEKIKISFRSKEGYPVDKIAEDLGGGGHKLASGCTITGQDKKSLIANVISLCNNILLSAEN